MLSSKNPQEKHPSKARLTEARFYEVMYAFACGRYGISAMIDVGGGSDNFSRFLDFVKKNEQVLGDIPREFAFMKPAVGKLEDNYLAMRKEIAGLNLDRGRGANLPKKRLETLCSEITLFMTMLQAAEVGLQKGHLEESVLNREFRKS